MACALSIFLIAHAGDHPWSLPRRTGIPQTIVVPEGEKSDSGLFFRWRGLAILQDVPLTPPTPSLRHSRKEGGRSPKLLAGKVEISSFIKCLLIMSVKFSATDGAGGQLHTMCNLAASSLV